MPLDLFVFLLFPSSLTPYNLERQALGKSVWVRFSSCQILTRGGSVRSANATIVLCRPPAIVECYTKAPSAFQGRRSSASSFEQFVMRLNYRSQSNGSAAGSGDESGNNTSGSTGAIPRTGHNNRRKSYNSSTTSLDQ